MRLSKIIAASVMVVVVLVVAGILILVTMVRPNNFKPLISQQVLKYTNRILTIDGDLSWTFFPNLGIKVGHASLSNLPSFAAKNFAEVNSAAVSIKLLPLLSGEVEPSSLELSGLTVNLIRNPNGKTNWQDLTAPPKTKVTVDTTVVTKNNQGDTTASHSRFTFKPQLPRISIADANVNWLDLKDKQTAAIKQFNLDAKNISPNSVFPIKVAFAFASNQPALTGDLTLTSDVALNQAQQLYKLNNVNFTTHLQGAATGNQAVTMKLTGNAVADLAQDTLVINNLVTKLQNLNIEGSIAVKDFMDEPQANGKISIKAFDLKQLLASLGKAAPATQNAQALKKLSADFDFSATKESFSLKKLTAVLDESTLKGDVALTSITNKTGQFNLALDHLSLNDYLPPAGASQKTQASAAADSGATPAASAPGQSSFAYLQPYFLKGNIRVDHLNMDKFKVSNLTAAMQLQNGTLQLSPLKADIYQGTVVTNTSAHLTAVTPSIALQGKLSGMQVASLLNDLGTLKNKAMKVTGVANADFNVTTAGLSAAPMTRNLNGTASFKFTNGTLEGINIVHIVQSVSAFFSKQALPVDSGNKTDFGTLTGTAKITQGVIHNNDFLMDAPDSTTRGEGTIDLVSERVDFSLNTTLKKTSGLANNKTLAQLTEHPIPIRISGSLSSPSINVDYQALTKDVLQEQLQRVQEKVQDKLKDQLQQKAGDLLGNFLH